MSMYTNPTHTTGAGSKFAQYVVTAVVLLIIAGYYFGGIETVLKVATSVRYMFAHNPEFEQGKRLVQVGDWNGALAAFNKAVEREPDNFAVYNERANVELVLGQETAGLKDLETSLRLKQNVDAYLIHANYIRYKRAGDLGEADVKQALALDPNSFNAISAFISWFQQEGPEYDEETIKLYSHAIELFPQARKGMAKAEVSDRIYSLHAGRARRLLSQKRYQEALADYNAIFDQGSEDAYMLIMQVDDFKAIMTQLAPDAKEYQGFQKLIKRIEATGAQVVR